MFVKSAKFMYDVDCENHVIEVKTDKWLTGTGWREHTDFLYTSPKGNWTELKFTTREQVRYVDFLNTMVNKNLEIARKIALLHVDRILESPNRHSSFVNLMNSIPILDPTFVPPDFNLRCRWQRELLETICNEWVKSVILTCLTYTRLIAFSQQVSLIE